MDEADDGRRRATVEERKWIIFSKKFPKSKVIYFCQIVIIYIVVLASLINLSIQRENQTLWSSLLSACIGYVLPSPQLVDDDEAKEDDEPLLPHASEQ